mmetsp:Transcript_47432/g.84854  ORF Transcript_47432/g.84854 Transcript_47432/m.84854 type:complete len:262 (+) Transcript_47432:292-1077(+)
MEAMSQGQLQRNSSKSSLPAPSGIPVTATVTGIGSPSGPTSAGLRFHSLARFEGGGATSSDGSSCRLLLDARRRSTRSPFSTQPVISTPNDSSSDLISRIDLRAMAVRDALGVWDADVPCAFAIRTSNNSAIICSLVLLLQSTPARSSSTRISGTAIFAIAWRMKTLPDPERPTAPPTGGTGCGCCVAPPGSALLPLACWARTRCCVSRDWMDSHFSCARRSVPAFNLSDPSGPWLVLGTWKAWVGLRGTVQDVRLLTWST